PYTKPVVLADIDLARQAHVTAPEPFAMLFEAAPVMRPTESDAAALGSVSRYVARVKCAMLGWVAAEDAIRKLS
ncbi:MAG: hypothetical protein V4703_06025, partial [Actinomycetota bacterium]